MCGRYKLTVPFREIVRLYELTNSTSDRFDNLRPRYNIAPTQEVAVIRLDASRRREFATLRWGLIPFWAKDVKVGYSLINAMSETVADKPSFREAFKTRRCLAIADGFYEWKPMPGKLKQPYLIRMFNDAPFAFAGPWEMWKDKGTGEVIESCTIITCPPNALCSPIHNRMTAILAPEDYAAWLGEVEATPDQLKALLRPFTADLMEAIPISTKVNSVKNDSAAVLEAD